MTRSPEKPLAMAGLMTVLALCYQLGVPQWVYGGLAVLAGAGIAAWFALEKRVSAWLPDSEFPAWLIIQMS